MYMFVLFLIFKRCFILTNVRTIHAHRYSSKVNYNKLTEPDSLIKFENGRQCDNTTVRQRDSATTR